MKELIVEFRLLIAEKLLGWVLEIAPAGKHGDEIRFMIKRYFEFVIKSPSQYNGE